MVGWWFEWWVGGWFGGLRIAQNYEVGSEDFIVSGIS
jgi:hypothetical protein